MENGTCAIAYAKSKELAIVDNTINGFLAIALENYKIIQFECIKEGTGGKEESGA